MEEINEWFPKLNTDTWKEDLMKRIEEMDKDYIISEIVVKPDRIIWSVLKR